MQVVQIETDGSQRLHKENSTRYRLTEDLSPSITELNSVWGWLGTVDRVREFAYIRYVVLLRALLVLG
jgi:hypothetical protein